jgi:hypothetical protein
VNVGSFNQISDSLHVYDSCLDRVINAMAIEPEENKESLALPKRESEEVFRELERVVDELVRERRGPEELKPMLRERSLPEGYMNMLRIVVAETARRRHRTDVADEIMCDCSNQALSQVWHLWLGRVHKHTDVRKQQLQSA